MDDVFYTHARWTVKPGREEEFIDAWKAMASVFAALPDAIGHGTLIRSLDQRDLFYSFGPWKTMADVLAMRADPQAQQAVARVRDLCEDFSTGNYEVAALVSV